MDASARVMRRASFMGPSFRVRSANVFVFMTLMVPRAANPALTSR
jgi:hypothetical protein